MHQWQEKNVVLMGRIWNKKKDLTEIDTIPPGLQTKSSSSDSGGSCKESLAQERAQNVKF